MGTFLIGLREGLEATLIVSIVGAFLRRSGRSIRPMLVGVAAAVVLSIVVGVGLDALSDSLPQRQQEMLETVIGVVAVVFVTTMIIWMNRNAQNLKGELEHEAAQAISTGGSFALALMAFLAVLKEGFETAVFLLAAAQATHGSRWAALFGGLTGIAVAIVIGVGIYYGGLKLNLGRFFRITGVFLVFIAAGLVTNSLRTAHEAGWITVGQRQVFDFSSWMPARSVLGALVTGMFGVPNDPRLIEVLGWLLYAIPVLAVFLWPPGLAASPRARSRLLFAVSAGLAAVALVLALAIPTPQSVAPGPTRTVHTADGTTTVTMHSDGDRRSLTIGDGAPIPLVPAGTGTANGIETQLWQASRPTDPGVTTTPVSLAQLSALAGGRLPVGISPSRTPGPFDAVWLASTSYSVVGHGDSLISAKAESNRIAVLHGGGLAGAKTVSLGGLGTDWSTIADEDDAATAAIAHLAADGAERMLWRRWLPVLLAAAAVGTAGLALRVRRQSPAVPNTSEERHHHHDQQKPSDDEIGVS